ncbi:MAG TPA: SRPBCC domain-containing protein [Casimicrobiaceae bacterium]|nr:SRPBCC domain-containing protein [Casimicrobiaceae bacterium]
MVRDIDTEIGIDAPAQRVWDVLVDFAEYPRWNPFLLSVAGTPMPGRRIRFWFELPRGFRAPACATVLRAEPEKELRWAGSVPGLFRAEHYFVIERASATGLRFRHGEIFSGLLLPLVWPVLRRRGREVHDAMNRALKERVEHAGARR